MYKFIYKDKARKIEHNLVDVRFDLQDVLDEFRSFLRGSGFEFEERIVLGEELEEGACTLDEIVEENESLQARVKKLEKELLSAKSNVPVTRCTVITSEGTEYETWLDEHSQFLIQYQDEGRTLKLFEVANEDMDLMV